MKIVVVDVDNLCAPEMRVIKLIFIVVIVCWSSYDDSAQSL